jgi:hypothetical protein
MGRLGQLKADLADLADELEQACQVPDAVQQPEVVQARALVEQARSAVASAFLSRRALAVADESVGRARDAIAAALAVSRVLRERSQSLKSQAAAIREVGAEARRVSATLAGLADQAGLERGPEHGEVLLESAIPSGHPAKREIEAAIVETLAAAEGHWHVWITVPATGPWWGLCVRGPSVDWVGTLQDAGEQTAAAITARLAPLVAVAQVEARYRRALRRSSRRRPKAGPPASRS